MIKREEIIGDCRLMEVRPIKKLEVEPWLLKKHYAKRLPPISFAFGLYEGNDLSGIITYGSSANNSMNKIAGLQTIELNRLCVSSSQKNASSVLVGRSLKMLPCPLFVFSYADGNQGHIGYIYQATNWKYTGESTRAEVYCRDGEELHSKSFSDLHGTRARAFAESKGYKIIKKLPKHRYVYVLGSKKIKKAAIKDMPWPVLSYPKGETKRYDAGGEVTTQKLLF